MDQTRSVTALVANVAVSMFGAPATVTADASGFTCSASSPSEQRTCWARMTPNSTVTFSAAPDPASGAQFLNWASGGSSCTGGSLFATSCTVQINDGVNGTPLGPRFGYPLDVQVTGTGTTAADAGGSSCPGTRRG